MVWWRRLECNDAWTPLLVTKLGWSVKIKSIQEGLFLWICVGHLMFNEKSFVPSVESISLDLASITVNFIFIKCNAHDITTFVYLLHDVATITFFKLNTVNAQTWTTAILFIVVRCYFWFFKRFFLRVNFGRKFLNL